MMEVLKMMVVIGDNCFCDVVVILWEVFGFIERFECCDYGFWKIYQIYFYNNEGNLENGVVFFFFD